MFNRPVAIFVIAKVMANDPQRMQKSCGVILTAIKTMPNASITSEETIIWMLLNFAAIFNVKYPEKSMTPIAIKTTPIKIRSIGISWKRDVKIVIPMTISPKMPVIPKTWCQLIFLILFHCTFFFNKEKRLFFNNF